MEDLGERLKELFSTYKLPSKSRSLPYGTSGYRCKADLLEGVATRIGAYACLRSIQEVIRAYS